MRKSILFSCIPIICVVSCAVLSDSQLQGVHAFAVTAKNYSNFPSEAVRKGQRLQYNNNVLEATGSVGEAQITRQLDTAKAQYESSLKLADKMDLSLNLIQTYAALLEQLSSSDYTDELGRSAKELSGDLGDAIGAFNAKLSTKIPDNVAKGISQIITIIGDRIIKNKQAKAIKKFVPEADTLIQLTSNNLVSALDEDLKPLLGFYQETFKREFKTSVFDQPARVNYNVLQFYIKTNADYANLELLRKRCVVSAKKMALAHKQLQANIRTKKTLKELLGETKEFIADVKELYGIITTISNNN